MRHDFGFDDNDINNIDGVIDALRELVRILLRKHFLSLCSEYACIRIIQSSEIICCLSKLTNKFASAIFVSDRCFVYCIVVFFQSKSLLIYTIKCMKKTLGMLLCEDF